MKNIFLVTTVHIGDPVWQYGVLHVQRKRCVGWFPNLTVAEAHVMYNMGDIHEDGYYDHCVIEKVFSGIYSITKEEHWYKWSEKEERYIPSQKPKGLERIKNFGIG